MYYTSVYKYLLFTMLAFTWTACSKFDNINTDPDKSATSRSEWLATGMLGAITVNDIKSDKGFVQPFLQGKYSIWKEGGPEDLQYNRLGRATFNRLTVLRNVDPMINNAPSDELKNSYTALGHFIRAWQFFQTTMQLGDIPYSEAIKGESDKNIKPKYDSQKDVFKGILNELDQADELFKKGATFSGDFIYSGNLTKWRKLVNSFQLHVLMNLYKKTTDADLNVVGRFQKIVAERPVMQDYTDNFAVTYQNSQGSCYPWSNTAVQTNPFIIYSALTTTYIDALKTNLDRRLFYVAEPAPSKRNIPGYASDFNSYIGIEPSAKMSDINAQYSAGNFSDFNKRYVDLFNAEPVGLLCAWDVKFLLAEATVRGWITGTPAQSYYAAGIQESMKFLVNYTPAAYNHGVTMDAAYIAAYPATIALAGTAENQIKQIITQKYLAGFLQNCDYNAWYENRRTGYPEFVLNPATNLNTPSTKFPLRWLYPSTELTNNSENLDAAIKSQYNGNDNVNETMWLLK